MPLTSDDLDQLLTRQEVADLLGIHVDTVKKMMRAGDFDIVRIGTGRGLPRIPRRSVVDMINKRLTRASRSAGGSR